MTKFTRLVSFILIVCTVWVHPVLGALNYNVISFCDTSLSFSGSTACCQVEIETTDADAEITATILLQKQNAYGRYVSVESWKETGTGFLFFYDTYANAEPGQYRLKVDIDATGSSGSDSFSINETAILPVSN